MENTKDSLEHLLKSNFSDQFIISAFNNILNGHDAYLRFVSENRPFLEFGKKEVTACGHLHSLAIEKAFHLTSFNPNFSTYQSSLMEVNKWHYKAFCIYTDNFIVNIARTHKPHKLPNASGYRKEFSRANGNCNPQLTFDVGNDPCNIIAPLNYGIITYNFQNDSLTHAHLIIPDEQFKYPLHSINLMQTQEYSTYYIPEDEKEELIINIKEELTKKISNDEK